MLNTITVRLRLFVVLLATGSILAGNGLAQAVAATPSSKYEFAFYIPVALKDINSNISQVLIHCAVTGTNAFGEGTQQVPLKGNAFNGTIIVYISDMTKGNASDVAKWNCRLIFAYPGGEAIADDPKGNVDPTWVTHNPQSKVNVEVSGSITTN